MKAETWRFGAFEPTPCGGEQHIVRDDGEHRAVVDCDDGDMRLAHLVKAAPALLAACERVLVWSGGPGQVNDDDDLRRVLEQVEAVVALARAADAAEVAG